MKTRYILIGVSVLLVAFIFMTETPTAVTVTGHVIYSLSYAFTPALFGLVVAGIQYAYRRIRGKPQSFSPDWHWAWGVFLIINIASTLWGYFR